MNNDIKILKKGDKYFPQGFLKLRNCPEIIFVKGNEKILNDFAIAIVGSRKPTFEGLKVCDEIANELAKQNINIVSGLATGIDAQSHKSLPLEGKVSAKLTDEGFAEQVDKVQSKSSRPSHRDSRGRLK